jgi:hypothetical protein
MHLCKEAGAEGQVQRCSSTSANAQKYRDAEVHVVWRSRGAEHVQVQRCRGAEVQRCRGAGAECRSAEVQCWCRGAEMRRCRGVVQ